MGNLCCRRVVYSPSGADHQGRCHQQQPQQTQKTMSGAYHHAGDDCAINELLEGRMDLDVVLPDGRQVRLTVERRTPMMDLLVQAASATKISPGGHVIHVFGDGSKDGTLQYKPSTPIGSLDTNTICIVPKREVLEPPFRRMPRVANRPFEPTFRVQVHLPRNQLTVCRVSPRVRISELRELVCREKSLDTSRYQLVRPSDPAQALPMDMTLAEYGATEITLLSNSSIESHMCNSTSHILPYSKRNDEQKRKTGILRLLADDCKHSGRGTEIDGIDRNKRASSTNQQSRSKPKKRRPAPPPPPEAPSHSRQSSSDSSGYHEATSSFLHDSTADKTMSSDSSGVSSLDAKVTAVQPQKKRKAPPPPAPGDDPPAREESGHKDEENEDQSKECENSVIVNQDTADTKEPRVPEPNLEVADCFLQKELAEQSSGDEDESSDESDAVTKAALVALSARIEQDVTQQEIASSIQAAFHSLDCPQPSLLAIKQRDDGQPPPVLDETKEEPDAPLLSESPTFTGVENEALIIDEESPPRPLPSADSAARGLRRSSSLLTLADAKPKKILEKNPKASRHLQRSLSDLNSDDKEEFEAEQERLQREYIKLQRQFILWQQQLINNHAMLREECIVPQFARTLRQSHSLPEGEDYSENTTTSVPLVSRSLSYEPTKDRCSTLPRSAINIESLEFATLSLGSGSSTLRSSKTKSYFKPPQVRVSTKSRQRLPPEIKKEGDLDISDDVKMLSTILPTFESLKLISEMNDDDALLGLPRLKNSQSSAERVTDKNAKAATTAEVSVLPPSVNGSRENIVPKGKDAVCSNENKNQSRHTSGHRDGSKQCSVPPPPPPPTCEIPKKTTPIINGSVGRQNSVVKKLPVSQQVDPREQLMLEIRKFGGRTSLRKISLAS